MSMLAFSHANFDSTEWINLALQEREEENLEAFLASLNLKIHVASQEKSDQLEYSMVELASSSPRVLHELKRIEEQLAHLNVEMNNIHAQLSSFDQRNSSGVDQLYSLDTLKSNLEKSRDILRQHHTWNNLLDESKLFIEGSTKLSESADRLELMSLSLQTLSKMPGHEERQSTYQSLQSHLLESFLHKIRKDLLSSDLSPLHEYVYVYRKINKIQDLETEYISIRSDLIVQEWNKQRNSSTSSIITDVFASFYSDSLSLLKEELIKVNEIFGPSSSAQILSQMVLQAYSKISASTIELIRAATCPIAVLDSYSNFEKFITEFLGLLGVQSLYETSPYVAKLLSAALKCFESCMSDYIRLEGILIEAEVEDALKSVTFPQFSTENRPGSYSEYDMFCRNNMMLLCRYAVRNLQRLRGCSRQMLRRRLKILRTGTFARLALHEWLVHAGSHRHSVLGDGEVRETSECEARAPAHSDGALDLAPPLLPSESRRGFSQRVR